MTAMTISRGTGGYTVLELLMVVAIIVTLMALLITLFWRGPEERRRTEVIISKVHIGITLAEAQSGSAISPVEHPLAGSQAGAGGERFAFVRSDPRWAGMVARTGMALRGVPDPGWLTTDHDRLLMANDRYADRRVPLLYGAKRTDLGVLQSLRKLVTRYRQLPMPKGGATKVIDPTTGLPATTYTDAVFPDSLVPAQTLVDDPTFARLADTKPALDHLFGASAVAAELASLKALYFADPTLPTEVNAFRIPVEERSIGGVREGLVYTDADAGAAPPKAEDRWKPGRIAVSGSGTRQLDDATGASWVRYRLAGLAVYDAWGVELFVTANNNGGYRVISAAADGVLTVAPGRNLRLDTNLVGDLRERVALTDDDQDGAKDNLQ